MQFWRKEMWPMALHSPEHESLSKRETEILCLLARGLSDREIAERLVMTIGTVKWYNRQIYRALGVGSRSQAAIRARELNLLHEEPSGTAASFAALHAVGMSHLPTGNTRFIGREHETETIKRLLESARLLTLVGPPGTGKTRLALHAARAVADTFRDGAHFVSLGPMSDPTLVVNSIASIIGVKEMPGQPLIETLKQTLRDSLLLLILDNFEHLLSAALQVSELLAATRHLKVLATSREPLYLYGEQVYTVVPLNLPNLEHVDPQSLERCESTALFLQRARAVRSDIELTSESAAVIAQICLQLEGLPLAIELAAARMKLLTPHMILARLSSRLSTLTGGAQDLPDRQRTLHSTIEWSYNLLDDGEKTMFARLAIFRGGCLLETAEAVCGAEKPIDAFSIVESLVNKSLLQQTETPNGDTRLVMLETLHEYAWQRLVESDDWDMMHRRHAEYFTELAQRAEPELRQSGLAHWMACLESEENNLQAALEWTLKGGDIEAGLRLVASLRDFWVMSGRFSQGQYWSQSALKKSGDAPPLLRARATMAAGALLYISPQRALQLHLLEEAVELARTADDGLTLAWARMFLAMASFRQDTTSAGVLSLATDALSRFRALNHKPGMVQALNLIGEFRRANGEDDFAQAATEEGLALASETGEVRREAMLLYNLGHIAMHRADLDRAEHFFREGLIKSLEAGYDKRLIITGIVLLGDAIGANGEPERAVRLFGAADALFKPSGVGLPPGEQREHENILASVRGQLGAEEFQECWNQGRALSLEQATAHALEVR
jgi:predicted ATPase/DNA-binding CsgD family transcriptional regulator